MKKSNGKATPGAIAAAGAGAQAEAEAGWKEIVGQQDVSIYIHTVMNA